MNFINEIRERAKNLNKKIVFPEGSQERVLKAAEFLSQNEILKCVLLGNEEEIKAAASENNLNLYGLEIIDPSKSHQFEKYSEGYLNLRKEEALTPEQSRETVGSPLFFAAMMVRTGECDGSVAGSVYTTSDVLRAAIQIIGMAEDISLVSSTFEMVLKEGKVLTYADCAVVPQPDSAQLADIAISSAKTHRELTGEEPRVALLSFSTQGSAKHQMVEKVQKALEIAKTKAPDLKIDGELQADAALEESIAKRKSPHSNVAGQANVLIFPDLNAGNIAYKLTERLADAQAVGPILQGLAKPASDLSRGCSWNDIVDVACICAVKN
ncbi:phosphate acetyltransferase [candidate division KSB1 bacterium]|nr:phosphate acetyltransferase [candidate division KSB1 bacterium]TDI91891.1 MAG: phosphate acetyltransferase [Caldithrix sp.]TDI93843.1 MAG: phosphate acetyltransferase [Caldithrix sp.]